MVDIETEEQFLHEERKAIESYLQNVSLSKKEMTEYKKLAKALSELIKIKTKLNTLLEEKDSLGTIQELFSVVGLDVKTLKTQWVKKNKEYMDQSKKYEQKKKTYVKM